MRAFSFAMAVALLAGCSGYDADDPSKLRNPAVHQYGHDVAAPPARQVSASCSGDDLRALAADYMNPPLMALGDSLYNGVSSLRINWWLSEWSVPAMVGIGLGLVPQDADWQRVVDGERPRTFWGPQYPDVDKDDYHQEARSFGFDLERTGLREIVWNGALREQARNLLALYAWKPPSGRLFNDNLAFSGADTIDLVSRTAGSMRERLVHAREATGQQNDLAILERVSRAGPITGGRNFSSIARGFYLINAAFVLNPMRQKCIETLTPFEQVLLRKPKRLLVNIGSNNGIYRMGLEGVNLYETVEDDYAGRCTCIADYLGNDYLRDIATMIAKLEEEEAIETVYLNGLIPPSRIANLVPEKGSVSRLPGSIYYTAYAPAFSVGGHARIDGNDVRRADEFIAALTREVQRLMDEANARLAAKPGRPATAPRKFTLVDVDRLTARYDYKHIESDEKRMLIARGGNGLADVRFDLRPLNFDDTPRVYSKVAEGGFVSFDNMHLSSSGYAMLAGTVLDAIQANEAVSRPELRPLISPRSLLVLKSNAPFNFLRYAQGDATKVRGKLSELIAGMAGDVAKCLPEEAPQICRDGRPPAWPRRER